MKKQLQFIVRGMSRDIDVHKGNTEYSYDNQNIRITAREGSNLLSITNEKGNKEVKLENPLVGTVLGYCVLDNYIIVFTKTTKHVDRDYIFRLEYNSEHNVATNTTLYSGNLGFSVDHPIETLGSYETDKIQKVYWIDGLNQPRVINIVADPSTIENWENNPTAFDFIQSLRLNETVTVERNPSANGMFASGVIQYSFTYYNLYGQESGIFYTSPLLYISYNDRGGSPEDKINTSFSITIKNYDTQFDFIRVYSIHRTSIDAIPEVKRVTDISIPEHSEPIHYVDTGLQGNNEDPTKLLYIGGEELVPYTMTQKDNTLFFGNIKLSRKLIDSDIIDFFKNRVNKDLEFELEVAHVDKEASGYYPYKNQLYKNSNQLKTFKYLEWYRFGVQFQHRSGKWSEPIFITDKRNEVPIKCQYIKRDYIQLPIAKLSFDFPTNLLESLNDNGYIKMRPVVVYPELSEREVIAQGMVCPTVYNVEDRASGATFSQSSWFIRPNLPYNVTYEGDISVDPNKRLIIHDFTYIHGFIYNKYTKYTNGTWVEFRNNYPIPSNNKKNAEIQLIYDPSDPYIEEDVSVWVENNRSNFYVDQSIFTFHSPDIEFDDNIQNIDTSNLKFRIVGMIPMTSFYGDIDITTKTPTINLHSYFSEKDSISDWWLNGMHAKSGMYKPQISQKNISKHGFKSLVNGLFWIDSLYHNKGGTSTPSLFLKSGYTIYPFHKTRTLSNQLAPEKNTNTVYSILDTKRISNLKYSYNSYYLDSSKVWDAENQSRTGISGIGLYNSNELAHIKLPKQENSNNSEITYKGNFSKLLLPNNIKVTKGDTEISTYKYPLQHITTTDFINNKNIHKLFNLSGDRNSSISLEYLNKSIKSLEEKIKIKLFNFNLIPNTEEQETYLELELVDDPVSMKYKSTTHAVIALNYDEFGRQRVLPTLYDSISYDSTSTDMQPRDPRDPIDPEAPHDPDEPIWDDDGKGGSTVIQPINPQASHNSNKPFWDHDRKGGFTVIQDVIDADFSNVNGSDGKSVGPEYGWLWLGEIYNDKVQNRFGGETEEAFEANKWLPCGEAVNILEGTNTLKWTGGDTYYQRYDHIKTYPFTLEDENCITEIVSFMCETRVNLDGRYDRNRGQLNNFSITPKNFNILNPVYNQVDNFFTYRGVNRNRFNLDYFPNTVTWTLEKQLGEEVDSWTSVTMATTLDLDGDKGPVTSLQTFGNEIFAFQETAISNILFNSRVQIPASDGVPIEISSGNKIGGKRYISNLVGCFNKWSIVETPNGLYFIDSITKAIYLFNGQLVNLSEMHGFKEWTKDNSNMSIWHPLKFDGFISFYDKLHKDVYFVKDNTCLVYSEVLNAFTSFMDYNEVPMMASVDDKFISIKNNKLWLQNHGEYNNFFGKERPFSITYRASDISGVDKIWTNVEFRSDTWADNKLLHNKTFDTLTVWNEYQKGELDLTKLITKPSPLKKKFRVWRTDIPRDKQSKNKMQRIRNPWAYLKLTMNEPGTTKTELHDFKVDFID